MKKSTLTRVAALSMAALMAGTALAGCGGSSSSGDNKETVSSDTNTGSAVISDSESKDLDSNVEKDNSQSSGESIADSESSSIETAVEKKDYKWIKFAEPEGLTATKWSDTYFHYAKGEDDDCNINIVRRDFLSGQTLNDVAAKDTENLSNTVIGDTVKFSGYEWIPVHFDQDGNAGVCFFSQLNEDQYCLIIAHKMTENDAPVQTVMNSVEFIPE